MKQLIFSCMLFCMALSGLCQFVPQPLNYPGPGYWPFYYSISDPDHLWVGTFHEGGLPCAFSVKTTDGGDTWIFDTIPAPGNPGCVSICGWDINTCFYVFADMSGITDPSVWKTTDGGTSWSNMITSQFTGSFINFYHAFTADTGLAVGDPRDGYFEFQRTDDAGATWARVPSSDIPAVLPGEMGLNHSYSAMGNSVWFTTSKARCFHSVNRGLNWEVTQLFSGGNQDLGVCFSSEQKGAIWRRSSNPDPLVVTNDGGITWNTVAFPVGYIIQDMCRVPGWDGGFVVTAYKTGMRVYFTPDMFNTLTVLESSILSNGAVEFYDVATGWLGGGESGTNEIYKFSWVLNTGELPAGQQQKLAIFPNPSSGQSFLKLPEGLDFNNHEIRISDMAGREVSCFPVRDRDYCSLDASGFRNGSYLVGLYSGNTVVAMGRLCIIH